jgi:hypothetical protein
MRIKAWESFVFCADNHGDEHDPAAVKAFFKFCEQWQPKHRIHGGDLWDYRAMRRGASEEEKKESMLRDYADGLQFLKDYRPQYFLRGNHDERIWDLAQTDKGILSDCAIRFTQEIEDQNRKLGCRMLPYHKREGVLKLGHLKMLHGYAHGIHAARKHALTYGSCLFGHVHSIDHVTLERSEKTMARAVGCLRKLDADYNRAQIGALRHAHGWAYGVIHKTSGNFHVWQAERVGEKFLCATELIEL